LSRALLASLDREKSQRRAKGFQRGVTDRLLDLSTRLELLERPACQAS